MKKVLFIIIVLSFSVCHICSDELIYKPNNPSFGGNPYNATWLMNSAKEQQDPVEEELNVNYQRDPLEQFKENLNRQILRKLATSIVEKIYSDEGIQQGQYSIGDYLIDISEEDSDVVIVIDDMATGNQTLLEIPNF